ncbi:TetR family transcriptional regulator [Nocardia farcinica]|uniref:HTH tetR-type domain-containing protein n=1 Tax=Nocardia farcinica TaxID=37329 RepID=A0A0H5NYA1_NOCFR|nr:TetR family transcriptional regulator [Nocardia farcinica]AXK86797.1 TetR family transcriptional regulator [Nocardia farcinica]MBF6070244.1 TetR family transcriptional regulator [Nocardia farcinica]MBF6234354.1 TetR family transcriptional regulator [Nocardia farcinica]MBF6262611.1 TetR family transcriptional regulator [Nocardia farcinica]MBF6281115.1 TetR family transcriptional regulator [Nocardia farcinica]
MSTDGRRTQIVATAVDLIADAGIRALTHRALDRALALPAGSASYYFRTRRALLAAVVDHIAERSRADFREAGLAASDDVDAVADGIGNWLDDLLAARRAQLLVRHALILELGADTELRERLAAGLFSVERVRELFAAWGIGDPHRAALDFVAVLEGAVFDRFAGHRRALVAGTAESRAQLTGLVTAYLRGVRGR